MKNILVTGGCGYIGSHVVKKLLKEGYSVVVFDNLSHGYKEVIDILSKHGKLEFIKGDLCVKKNIDKVFTQKKIDAVIHMAALCSIDESTKNPKLYFENNVKGTEHLLLAMQKANVLKMIFSSTCAVYGKAEYFPIDEKHPIKPENPYGESKRMAEEKIEQFTDISGFQYVIFRYFNVCGGDEEGEIGDSKQPSELLVQNAVRGALGIEPFLLTCPKVDTEDGTPVRDYIDVLDLADAHIQALKYLDDGGVNTILNLGNGKGRSVKEIIETVKKELGSDFEIKTSGYPRQGEYSKIFANIQKAKEIIGWQPRRMLKDSIQNLKMWYQQKPQGYKK